MGSGTGRTARAGTGPASTGCRSSHGSPPNSTRRTLGPTLNKSTPTQIAHDVVCALIYDEILDAGERPDDGHEEYIEALKAIQDLVEEARP